MKSKKESVYFLKPLLGLLLLFSSLTFQPYSPVNFTEATQTEWVGEELKLKKGKTAGFSSFFSGAITRKSCYTTADFSIMLKSQDQVLQLRHNLQNFHYTNYKNTLQKCLFRAAIKISVEVPLSSEPV